MVRRPTFPTMFCRIFVLVFKLDCPDIFFVVTALQAGGLGSSLRELDFRGTECVYSLVAYYNIN